MTGDFRLSVYPLSVTGGYLIPASGKRRMDAPRSDQDHVFRPHRPVTAASLFAPTERHAKARPPWLFCESSVSEECALVTRL